MAAPSNPRGPRMLVDPGLSRGTGDSGMANLPFVEEGTLVDKSEVAEPASAKKVGWWARHTSVATRLAIGILVVSIVSLVASVIIAVAGSGSDGEELLHENLSTVAGARAAEVSAYVGSVGSSLEAMGAGRKAAGQMKQYLGIRDIDVPYRLEGADTLFGIDQRERNFVRIRIPA